MTHANWVRTPWCEELTSWKLGIRDNCGDALAPDTNRMSAPLSFDHRFCAKQQFKFVCIISDSCCIENSRWWKRLKSERSKTKILEQKGSILFPTNHLAPPPPPPKKKKKRIWNDSGTEIYHILLPCDPSFEACRKEWCFRLTFPKKVMIFFAFPSFVFFVCLFCFVLFSIF